jgi:hypothetical protein
MQVEGGEDASAEKGLMMKAVLVAETVDALGLRSLLDDETVVPNMMEVFEQRVARTRAFVDYARTSKLLGNSSVGNLQWDLRKVIKALNMVLGAAGVRLAGERLRPRSRQPAVRPSFNKYHLDSAAVAEMTELVKLRMRRSRPPLHGGWPQCLHEVASEQARARIEACELPLYGHLLTLPSSGSTDSGDTSSPMELRFKSTVEELTGMRWCKQRPDWLRNPKTGAAMELDMVCEELGMAVEYNGAQHYTYPNRFHSSMEQFDEQQERDRIKRELCGRHGVRLVEIVARERLEDEVASFKEQWERISMM